MSGDYWLVHGGKTNGDAGGGGYTFASGISTGEVLLLDLSQSFTTSSPPWWSINTTTSPTVAFHTLTKLKQSTQLMAFGGDVSRTASTLSGNDSACMLDITGYQSAIWSTVDASWEQPQRRVYQAADGDGQGSVWIVGGERDDGSYIQMDEMWMLNSSAPLPAFAQQKPPTGGLVGSTATMLSDGSLLLLGGQKASGMQSFDSVTSYSTTDKQWKTTKTKGVNDTAQGFPSARMSHVAVSLSSRRVLIHGGATENWSQAMGDSWILDWSQDPPTWSDVTSSNGIAPSARFGHSAIARGDSVVLGFGWAGYNPADAAVYVFDAASLTSTSAGGWTGGGWSTTYTADGGQSPSGGSTAVTGGSSSGSNGNADGSGSSNSGSSDTDSSANNQSSTTSDPLSNGDNPTSPPKSQSSLGGTGAKAGAALGALLGVGLIAGAGYLIYRKRRPDGEDDDHFNHDDGTGLLRGSNHYYGADDDPHMMEKGIEYTGVGVGGIASFQAGTKPMGPRTAPRNSEMAAAPWSMSNVGHAMEGSGPHLRERLALMTGIGLGGAAAGRPQRFDMLADEDDERIEEKEQGMAGMYGDDDDDDGDDDERYNGVAKRIRERSYGKIDQYDDEDHHVERSYGDLAGIGAGYHGEGFVTSPFEDAAMDSLAARELDDDESASFINTIDTEDVSDNTSQSRNHSNSSTKAQHNHGNGSKEAGILSFSDAASSSSNQKVGRSGSHPSSLMRRSSTWWDRFMGQSFLERSASGRLLPGPRAEEPIRDPTAPPALSAIREASAGRLANVSEDDPFADRRKLATTDEMGRYYEPYTEDQHSRSLSSVQSGHTMTSSVMEARLQGMDVVQRVGTASSRRTFSSGGGRDGSTSSSGGLSRGVSLRTSAGHQTVASPSQSTPGEVIFDGRDWNNAGPLPGTVEEGDDTVQGGEMLGDASMDIVEVARAATSTSKPRKRSNTGNEATPFHSHDSGMKRSRTTALQGRSAKDREFSYAPSLTPSTTKRARQNRQLTAPVSPVPSHRVAPPVRGSVLDRVKAIEQKRFDEGEAHLPIPRSPTATDVAPASPSASPHVYFPGRGGQPILTKLATEGLVEHDSAALVSSPLSMLSPVKDKARYSHGLVPKPQLFVANPDGRNGSADS